jgi:hypothetical protein
VGVRVIELSVLIEQLRDELERAVVGAAGKALRFALDSVDIEVEVVAEQSAEGNGKVRFWVAELGGQAGVTHASTQRVRLALKPTLEIDGVRTTAYVSGEAAADEE